MQPVEKIQKGTRFESQHRTITATDFSLLNTLVWATAPVHTNLEFARDSPFGDLILDGPSALAVAVGLAMLVEDRFVHQPANTQNVALVGLENVRFRAPVLPFDTLHVQSQVEDVRPTKNADRAIVRYGERAEKTDGTILIEWQRVMLVEGRVAER